MEILTDDLQAEELSEILSGALDLSQKAESLEAENALLKAQIKEMEEWISENRVDLKSTMIILDMKKEEIASMQKTLDMTAASIEASKTKVAVREKEVGIRERKAKKAEEDIDRRYSRISDREYRYGSSDEELAYLDERQKKLSNIKEQLDTRADALDRKAHQLALEKEKLDSQSKKISDTRGYLYDAESRIRDYFRSKTTVYKVIIGILAAYAAVVSIYVFH